MEHSKTAIEVECVFGISVDDKNAIHFKPQPEGMKLLCFQAPFYSENVDMVPSSEGAKATLTIETSAGYDTKLGFWLYTTETTNADGTPDPYPSSALSGDAYMDVWKLVECLASCLDKKTGPTFPLTVVAQDQTVIANLLVGITVTNPESKRRLAEFQHGPYAEQFQERDDAEEQLFLSHFIPEYANKSEQRLRTVEQNQLTRGWNKKHPHRLPPEGPWYSNTNTFTTPMGFMELPMWSLVTPMLSTETNGWTANDVNNAIDWALYKLSTTAKEVEMFPDATALLDIGATAATLVVHTIQYRLDHTGTDTSDQWSWLSHHPDLKHAGADCDDMAEYTMRTLHAIQHMPPQGLSPTALKVQRALQEYEFGLAICTLYIHGSQRYQYHCAVAGFRKEWIQHQLAGEQAEAVQVMVDQPLPAVFIECTDFTATSWTDMYADIEDKAYKALPADLGNMMVRTPSHMIQQDDLYGHLLCVMMPQFIASHGVAELFFEPEQGQMGVPVSALCHARREKGDLGVWPSLRIATGEPVSPELAEDVYQVLATMPPFQPLPKINPVPAPYDYKLKEKLRMFSRSLLAGTITSDMYEVVRITQQQLECACHSTNMLNIFGDTYIAEIGFMDAPSASPVSSSSASSWEEV